MSLKHELNPQAEDAGLIERIDAILARTADRLGTRWQEVTPFKRQGLTLGCYAVASLLSFAYVLLTREVLFLGVAVLAYAGSAPGKQRGSLVEELQLEATGLPKHTLKYLAVGLLALGMSGIVGNLPIVIVGTLNGNVLPGDLAGMVGGLALVLLKTADYIARTTPNHRDGDHERPVEHIHARQPSLEGSMLG